MPAPTNTYSSSTLLNLGQVPVGIEDPVLYQELLDIHDAIEAIAPLTGKWIGNFRFICGLEDFDNYTDTVITLQDSSEYYIVCLVDIGDRIMVGNNVSFRGMGGNFSIITSSASSGALLTTTGTVRADSLQLQCTGGADNLDCTDVLLINFDNVILSGGRPGTINANPGSAVIIRFSSMEVQHTPFTLAGNLIRIELTDLFPRFLSVAANDTFIKFAAGIIISDRITITKGLMTLEAGAVGYEFEDITNLPNEGVQIQDTTFRGDGTPVVGLLPSDNEAFFKDNVGLNNSFPNSGWSITNNTLNTSLSGGGGLGVPVIMATDNITLSTFTQRFTLDGVTLTYTGAQPRAFQATGTFVLSVNANNQRIGIQIFKNGVGTGVVFSTTATGSGPSRVEGLSVAGPIAIAPGDEIEARVFNLTSGNNVTVTDAIFQMAALGT